MAKRKMKGKCASFPLLRSNHGLPGVQLGDGAGGERGSHVHGSPTASVPVLYWLPGRSAVYYHNTKQKESCSHLLIHSTQWTRSQDSVLLSHLFSKGSQETMFLMSNFWEGYEFSFCISNDTVRPVKRSHVYLDGKLSSGVLHPPTLCPKIFVEGGLQADSFQDFEMCPVGIKVLYLEEKKKVLPLALVI